MITDEELIQEQNTPEPEPPQIPRRTYVIAAAGVLVVILLLFTIAVPSLLRSRQSAQSPTPLGQQVAPELQQVAARAPSGPMVIRTISLRFETNAFDSTRSQIEAIVRQFQGYVDNLNFRGSVGYGRYLTGTLRIPEAQADAALTELRKLGRVQEETQASSDVTSQDIDLTARLTNARNSEQRLLALMRERTGSLKEVIEMEREITSVRENIERMQAQQKDLRNKAAFVTIALNVSEEVRPEVTAAPSTGSELRKAAADGLSDAHDTIVGIALFLLRYGPTLMIWATVLGLITLIAVRLKRRAAL